MTRDRPTTLPSSSAVRPAGHPVSAGVTLGAEHVGEATAPLVLLVGAPTMLSWSDAVCAALARGGRHVVRYDLRDSGASTTVDRDKRPAT